jgi:hypothetical protein
VILYPLNWLSGDQIRFQKRFSEQPGAATFVRHRRNPSRFHHEERQLLRDQTVDRRKNEIVFNGPGRWPAYSMRGRMHDEKASNALVVNSRPCSQFLELTMRSTLVIALAIASVLLASSAVVNAGSITATADLVPNDAPIGHLQPRGQRFSPRSSAEQNMQQQMSIFNAEQQKQDQRLDDSLNICRGC